MERQPIFASNTLVEAVNSVLSPEDRNGFWDGLEMVLRTLTYREREILKLRYGFADGYSYTAAEVARVF